MRTHRTLTGFALLMAIMVAGASAAIYSLPDAGIQAGQSGTSQVVVNSGADQAAIHLAIDFNSSLVTPTAVAAGSGASGYTAVHHVVDNAGSTDQLRIVLYSDPVTTFTTGNNPVIDITWTAAAGQEGQIASLTVQEVSVSDVAGISGAGGSGLAGVPSTIDGAILITGVAPTGSPVSVADPNLDPTIMNNWTTFEGFYYPANDPSPPSPIMEFTRDSTGDGTVSISTVGSQYAGYAGWGSGNARIPWQEDSLYRIDWTLGGEVPAGSQMPVFRLRVNEEETQNTMAEIVINSVSLIALEDAESEVYSMFFEPSDLGDELPVGMTAGLSLVMDVIDIYPGDTTNVYQGKITVQDITVTRYDNSTNQVDNLFVHQFPANGSGQFDHRDSNLWTQAGELPSWEIPRNEEIGTWPADNFDNYETFDGFTRITTNGTPDYNPDTVGYFQVFGLKTDVVDLRPGAIWRNTVEVYADASNDASDAMGLFRLRNSLETQAYSTLYYARGTYEHSVHAQGWDSTTMFEPTTTTPVTMVNYFAYPDDIDITSLVSTDNSIFGEIGYMALSNQSKGSYNISHFQFDSADATALLP